MGRSQGVAMRIDPSLQYLGNDPSQGVGNAKGQPKLSSADAGAPLAPDANAPDAGDTVQLSGTLSEVQRLTAQLAQTPDVRASRVAALQQQVQQGTYTPSNERIASAVLSDLFGSGSGS
jgi:flagellar biosynthesis anti-sigma factor FlgM